MSRDLTDLRPEMRTAAGLVLAAAAHCDLDLLVSSTYRSIWEQARLYRRSRPLAEIVAKQAQLDARGYGCLAAAIDAVGPQYGQLGKHVTHAGPGESWHQWGAAVDAVPWLDAKTLAWDITDDDPRWPEADEAWQCYGAAVRQAGLAWGGDWGWDRPHCQLRSDYDNPLDAYTPANVDEWAERMGWHGREERRE